MNLWLKVDATGPNKLEAELEEGASFCVTTLLGFWVCFFSGLDADS